MMFLGLPAGVLLGLGAAVAVTVLFLYVLKLRRRAVAVPFARIWQRVLLDRETSSLFARLRRLFSLLLQLLIAGLLVLALGDPRRSVVRSEGKSYFVLVDQSASMQATDVYPSRIDVARSRLRKMIEGLGTNDRMLIAGLGRRVTPLSTLTDDATELMAAVDQIQARDTEADLVRGLELAQASLYGQPGGVVVLLSDGGSEVPSASAKLLHLEPLDLQFSSIGKEGDNAAITAFSVRRYPLDMSRYEVMVELSNSSQRPLDIELTILGDGLPVDVSRIRLEPDETTRRFHQDLAGASRSLEAELRVVEGGRDWLAADDRAYALMPQRQRARILVVSDGNTYLDAALLLDEYLDVFTIKPDAYPPSGRYDVTIFDRVAPDRDARTGAALYLDPPQAQGPVLSGKEIEMFGFDRWDENSPLLKWMAMADIQVLSGRVLKPRREDHVVGASDLGPIVVEGEREGLPFVVVGFDPRQSDWVLRVGWPLFVLNTIHRFVEQSAGFISSYRTGDACYLPVPTGLREVELGEPKGGRRTISVRDGSVAFVGDDAGFYDLFEPGGQQLGRIAMNLVSPTESQIEPRRHWKVGERVAMAVQGFDANARENLWVYLVLAVALLSGIEWFTYHRRWTV